MGWMSDVEKGVFLCHFDKETMLHEMAHAKSPGFHGDPWAKNTWKLYDKYLKGNELTLARNNLCQYLSGKASVQEEPRQDPAKIHRLKKYLVETLSLVSSARNRECHRRRFSLW